ncbi:MAG: glycerol-3-phosphate 1-O-acyltransferase PlsY [Planctomycetaceae bacterium]|nr:glycerol-3-phosphate 1-O-acyltransferase PlsY [Planctomycetaceae bacterium]
MTPADIVQLIAMALAGYVLGSTPTGVIIARFKGVDLRKSGSGNVGATNVGRVLGRRWGYLCFALDVGKGFAAAFAAVLICQDGAAVPSAATQLCWLLTGAGAVLGHVFSFWLKFRGGKGVATGLGVVLGIYPYMTFAGLAALGVWVVVTLASRYVSMGSVVAAAAFVPLMTGIAMLHDWPLKDLWPLVTFSTAMIALIIIRHGGNIVRLVRGTENKIGLNKP